MTRASLRRAHPIAVKAVGHAVAELHQRDGAGFDVGGVEHREVAAVLPRAPDHREQPAVAFRGILARSTNTGSEMVSPAGSR